MYYSSQNMSYLELQPWIKIEKQENTKEREEKKIEREKWKVHSRLVLAL